MRNERNQSVFGPTLLNTHSSEKMDGVEKSAYTIYRFQAWQIYQPREKYSKMDIMVSKQAVNNETRCQKTRKKQYSLCMLTQTSVLFCSRVLTSG